MDKCKIEKIKIVNFKTFKEVSFNFNNSINVLTGINNCGKTTVLEAIALWNECFIKLIKQAQRSDASIGISKGEYRLGNKVNYFDFEDIVSIRSPYYEDIFYNLDTSNKILLEITIKNNIDNIDIGFTISKASGSNYEIKLSDTQDFDYVKFNNFFMLFPNPINTLFASPVANILLNEEFKTEPIIRDSISRRESIKVLRNRLYNLKYDLFLELEKAVSYILSTEIKLDTKADKKRDTKIDYDIQLNSRDIFKNISLVGSGTLQIIEILLSVFDEKKELNIVLLDEPDSHIHRDIQKRLIDVLSKHTENTQIFITTHNESLIRSTKADYIFHLEANTQKEYFPITYNTRDAIRKGLQPSKQIKVLQSMGSESALDLINALESDRLLLVEGKSDPLYLNNIIDKKYQNKSHNIMYWSLDGIDNIFKHIFSYKELFSSITNEKTLWEKSALIFDKDYFTDEQAKKLRKELKKKLGIPVYIWSIYTLESVLLTDISKFAILIKKYLYTKEKDVEKADIETCINEEVQLIIENKKTMFDDKKGEILQWIKNRRENLEKNSLPRNILPNETAFSEIKEFHLEKLNNNDLSSLATKEDIELIVSSVIKKYNIEDTDLFSQLISYVEISTYYDEWNKMIDKISL